MNIVSKIRQLRTAAGTNKNHAIINSSTAAAAGEKKNSVAVMTTAEKYELNASS